MKYYVIAGERSGDLHGGNLVKELRKADAEAKFRGFGGDQMEQAGVVLSMHYRDLAFMGLEQLLFNLRRITRYIRYCKKDILQFNPDALILIDYAGFNRRMAKFGKRHGIPVFYYISPKVWAWYQVRALELKKNVDKMFVILPFEQDFFKKYAWEVDYVGNPVLDAIKNFSPDAGFRSRYGLISDVIALLPGSRAQEVENIRELLIALIKNFPHEQFAVAKVSNLDRSYYEPFLQLKNTVVVEDDTYNLLQHSKAAVVTSGTATLETALLRVPQVVVYKTSKFSYWVVKQMIKVSYISLVNLIAGKTVVKELIQDQAVPPALIDEMQALLHDGNYRGKMLEEYTLIRQKLDIGSASSNTAKLMVKYLKKA